MHQSGSLQNRQRRTAQPKKQGAGLRFEPSMRNCFGLSGLPMRVPEPPAKMAAKALETSFARSMDTP